MVIPPVRSTGDGGRAPSSLRATEYTLDPGVRQLLPQHAEPLIQTCFHRAERAIEEIGDLLKRQAVVLLQDDGGSLFVWQHRHRLRDRSTELAPGDEIFDRFRRLGLRGELDQVD